MENETELLLIGHNAANSAIKQQLEQQIKREKSTHKPKTTTIKDITKLHPDEILSQKSVWLLYNRKNKQDCRISGMQAEGFIGLNSSLRERVLNAQLDSFLVADYFIKFDHAEVSR